MKKEKFILFYVFIILICIIMIMTKGYTAYSLTIDRSEPSFCVNFSYYMQFLFINFIVFLLIIISTFIITINKNNHIKIKWLLFLCIIIMSFFIPMGEYTYIRELFDKRIEYMYLWEVISYMI